MRSRKEKKKLREIYACGEKLQMSNQNLLISKRVGRFYFNNLLLEGLKKMLDLYRKAVLKKRISMANFSGTLASIENKLNQLIDRKQALENELLEYRSRQQELEKILAQQSVELDELKEKNKILRIAKLNNEGDNREIKLKINEIVREVDKCIAQLNQ
jgi:hypothetical protein